MQNSLKRIPFTTERIDDRITGSTLTFHKSALKVNLAKIYSIVASQGGPVRVKEGESKNFENCPQMEVSYRIPQMIVWEPKI